MSVKDDDKEASLKPAAVFHKLGFRITATSGTSAFLENNGIPNQKVNKVREGRPHIVDMMKNNEIHLVINTTSDKKAIGESFAIRRSALVMGIPYVTTIAGATATAFAIKSLVEGKLDVKTVQEYHSSVE